ncbi:MAG: hypothetical protein HFG34_03010 [Eubacterium sp.]|nr:hypothetical protein [Eubacterium sp.]
MEKQRSRSASDLNYVVRPALHLKLSALADSSNLVWSYAGKLTSNGEVIDAELPGPEEPTESPVPTVSPAPTESPVPTASPVPTESPVPSVSPVPTESPVPSVSPAPTESPVPTASPVPSTSPVPSVSPVPAESLVPTMSPVPTESLVPTASPAPIKISKITVTGKITKLAKGKKAKLKSIVEPANAANKNVVWSSSNPKVAAVASNGTVTAKTIGKAVITATAADGSGIIGSYNIKVVKHAVKKIIIKAKKKNVAAGKKVKITATIKTSGKKANKTLEWKTSNQNYATVNSQGVVTTKKAGKGKTVKITAMATDGTGKKDIVKIKIK